MNGLDIVVILGKGTEAHSFYNNLYQEQSKKRDTRLIYFIPSNSREPYTKYCRYVLKDSMSWWFSNQNSSALEYVNWYKKEIPVFIWKTIDYNTFMFDPSVRFLDDPKPENYVILVDEWVKDGNTKKGSKEDMLKLGYDKKKIYFYNDGERMLENFMGDVIELDFEMIFQKNK